jgi:hypothetical protein
VGELEHAIHLLDGAIEGEIEKHMPLTRPCLHSKRWWTAQLSKAKKAKQKLAQQAYRKWSEPDHPVHEAFCIARNVYSLQICTTKAEHWQEWLEGLDEDSI